MSTTYSVIAGDTWESIARKKYGSEKDASMIERANPGVTVLTPGISVLIPNNPVAIQDKPQKTNSGGLSEVAIMIDGDRFRFWDSIKITRSIDEVDTIELSAPFAANSLEFREKFQPFTYKPLSVSIGGSLLFSGTMVNVTPKGDSQQNVVFVNGYSLPGVMGDCNIPPSAFPLEFNNQGLREIANTIAATFGLGVDFRADQGDIFDKVAIAADEKALSFLAVLARQRNLIISNTATGRLLFWQSIERGNPVAKLVESSPVISIDADFNPQSYYSDITGIAQILPGLPSTKFTEKNKHLKNIIRPYVYDLPDTRSGYAGTAVAATLGRMFGATIGYTLRVLTWRDPGGSLWAPNTTIKITAPNKMIYKEYEFLIKSVEFTRDNRSESAILTLILPGSYSGKIPERLPWDE